MRKLLGTARIRNLRRIYEVSSGFEVDHLDRKGVAHIYAVPERAVARLYSLCRGETITSDEAAMRLSRYAEDLALRFHHGWKLKFLTQEILLILEIQGRATKHRSGRLFLYQVR